MNETLILGALDEEIDGIRNAIKAEVVKVGAFEIYRGNYGKSKIIVCRCGIGKVSSAAATAAILTVFPSIARVINTGVAGGIGGGVKRTDVVLGARAVQHDFDCTADGLEKGHVPGFDDVFFDGDEKMLLRMERALKAEGIKYHKGIIASGDMFVADKDTAQNIHDRFGAIACEMESAAIAQVCRIYNVPFIAMRAISDDGGDGAVASFYEFVHIAADNNIRAIKRFLQADE